MEGILWLTFLPKPENSPFLILEVWLEVPLDTWVSLGFRDMVEMAVAVEADSSAGLLAGGRGGGPAWGPWKEEDFGPEIGTDTVMNAVDKGLK